MQTQQSNTPMEETTPLVSFIIPAYNVPPTMLHECIESILQLSLRPQEREIILVDDGSDTPLLNETKELADSLVYVRQQNGGVSTARNRGMRMAQGEFVQFIDGDDLLIHAAYEHVLDLVRFGKSDMVMYNFTDKGDSQQSSYKDEEPMSGTELMRRENIHGSVCGYIFRRAIVGSLRFTPGVAYGEDEEFTPRLLLRAERVCYTNAQAYLYRMRPASAINRSDLRSRLRRLNDAKSVLMRLSKQSATLPAAERIAMQRRTAQLTMDYIYNVITLTHSRHYLNRQIEELRKAGLFPLPDRDYTRKYKWFRRMTSNSVGLTILMRVLPLMKKER